MRLLKRKILRLFQKHKEKQTELAWNKYKTARNEYQVKLDKAEQSYKRSLSESLSTNKNTKSWWRSVKHLLGKGGDTSYPTLNINDNVITDNKQKVAAFNEFFLSHSNIDISNAELPGDIEFPSNLTSVEATEQEVLDLLKSLDTTKASGPDGIRPKLLSEAKIYIVSSLTRLINLSLSSGKVPASWKIANVIPLFKKGDKSDINNYRPVSLLPCVSKILERIVFEHVYSYKRDNNLLISLALKMGTQQ